MLNNDIVRSVDVVTLTYFFYLCLLAVWRPFPPLRRFQILALSALAVVLVAGVSGIRVSPVVRDWSPAAYILVAYWASGLFYTRPMAGWEGALANIDRRVLPAVTRWVRSRSFQPFADALELAYLSVYLLVPVGFGVVYFSGIAFDVDRYWTVVVTSELLCYGTLPWVQTRPPRAVEEVEEEDRLSGHVRSLRQANLYVLRYGSIQVNTFPSGHAAGAVATALAVATVRPQPGAILGVWALAIVVGSVVGRYHYAADSVLGALVGLTTWLIVEAISG